MDRADGGTRSEIDTPLWSAFDGFVRRSSRVAPFSRAVMRGSRTATTCARRSGRPRTALPMRTREYEVASRLEHSAGRNASRRRSRARLDALRHAGSCRSVTSLLELRDPDGAFERSRPGWWRGFFAQAARSDRGSLPRLRGCPRRSGRGPRLRPASPAPRYRSLRGRRYRGGDDARGGTRTSWLTRTGHRRVRPRVERVRRAISRRRSTMVNSSSISRRRSPALPTRSQRGLAPLPVASGSVQGDGWAIVSASPDCSLARRGTRV